MLYTTIQTVTGSNLLYWLSEGPKLVSVSLVHWDMEPKHHSQGKPRELKVSHILVIFSKRGTNRHAAKFQSQYVRFLQSNSQMINIR